MATTTNYGWTTPNDTDLVKNGASAIRTTADAIDSSLFNITNGKNVGLVHLNTTTFSAQSSVSLNNVFSSTYDNYWAELTLTNSTVGAFVGIRFRAGGTDNSSANYSINGVKQSGTGAPSSFQALAQTHSYLGEFASDGFVSLNFASPFLTERTRFHLMSYGYNTSTQHISGSGQLDNNVSYDGFTFFVNSGTMSGKIRIYGYRNS